MPAGAPPAIDSTDAKLPVTDDAGQVGVVQTHILVVALAIHIPHRQLPGPTITHAVKCHLAGEFVFYLGIEAGVERLLIGTTQFNGNTTGALLGLL